MIVALLLVVFNLNPQVTPGAVRPLTTAEVCTIKWGRDARNVTKKDRSTVFDSYRVKEEDRHLYVVDHLIPRELAGADDVKNLWPQTVADSISKDRVENALHRAVCRPGSTLTLQAAQEQMRLWGRTK